MTGILFLLLSSNRQREIIVDQQKIAVSEVNIGVFKEYIILNGDVQPVRTVFLDALEGGTVSELFTEDGKILKAGDPILRLSNQQFQMDAINKETQLLEQQNNLRNARIQLENQTAKLKEDLLQAEYQLQGAEKRYIFNQKMIKENMVPRLEFESSEEEFHFLFAKRKLAREKYLADSVFRINQLAQIESSISLISKNLDFLQESMGNLLLRATISGQLSSFKAELGETKMKGENIGRLDVTDNFMVKAGIPEHYLGKIQTGMKASIRLSGNSHTLYIHKIHPEVSRGEFLVELFFENEKPVEIRRGQTLQVNLSLGSETEAIMIPRGKFFQTSGGRWIYVLTSSGLAEKRKIELGRQNSEFYEVISGLAPNEKIITSSYEEYKDADKLKLQ